MVNNPIFKNEMDNFDDLDDGLKGWLKGLSMFVTAIGRFFKASKFEWLGDG